MFLTDYVVKHTDYVICIVFFILISIIKLGERKEMLHMILFLSRSVVRSLIKNDAIEMEKAEVYQYGFEILFSSIITFLIAVLSGILLHCFAASMLFFIIFATFRQICGGYHAKHYWSCNLLFLGVINAVLVVYRFFPTDRFTTMHYIFLLVSLLIICIYAPVENENKPLSAEQVLLFRKISRIIVISLTMISCLIPLLYDALLQMGCLAFAHPLEFVIALPDHLPVFAVGMPDLCPEEISTVAADKSGSKYAFPIVLPPQVLPPQQFCLHQFKLLRHYDGRVTFLNEYIS